MRIPLVQHGRRGFTTALTGGALCAALWIGSYFAVFTFGGAVTPHRIVHGQTIDGRVECAVQLDPGRDHSGLSHFYFNRRGRLSTLIHIFTNARQHPTQQALGFEWGRVDKPTGSRGQLVQRTYLLAVPLWMPVLLLGAAAWLRRPRHTDAPRCARCGYDLRGSAEAGSCPECGEPIRHDSAAQST